ncbi:WD repeat domain phosphoinositide-interacting protein 2-like [Eurosta solidaginis]|uniref:WD repeat domain phosphoinositide-interacting protein 2-like n=1 Tax=Eurosta solidaginis TaxID=178769 RepID=UPI003530C062
MVEAEKSTVSTKSCERCFIRSIFILDGKDDFRIFSINNCDEVEDIYARKSQHIILVERCFNSSLVVMVTAEKPNCLQMLHFKKNQNICHCVYGSNIHSIRMIRTLLTDSLHIHDIRDLKMLHQIENIAPNELGLNTETVNIFKIDKKSVMMALDAIALQVAKIAAAGQLEKAETHSSRCTDDAKSETAVVTAATDTKVISTSLSSGCSD